MYCYIIEQQSNEYPAYQTFVDVTADPQPAIDIVKSKLQTIIDDCGEDEEIVTSQVSDNQIRIEAKGLAVFFITKRVLKLF